MENQKVEQAAKAFESQIREGKTECIAEQLHNMPEEDRKAITQQIKADMQQQPNSLPSLIFTDSGELKSANSYGNIDRVDHETKSTHSEYENGKLKTIDTSNFNGSNDHFSFDINGKLVSDDKTSANGDKEHDVYDSRTHMKTFAHTDFVNGDKDDVKFSRNSGNKETVDLIKANGSTDHFDYDRFGVVIVKSHFKNVDGSQVDAVYDAKTTAPIFVNVTSPSNEVTRFHYDPATQTFQLLPNALAK